MCGLCYFAMYSACFLVLFLQFEIALHMFTITCTKMGRKGLHGPPRESSTINAKRQAVLGKLFGKCIYILLLSAKHFFFLGHTNSVQQLLFTQQKDLVLSPTIDILR